MQEIKDNLLTLRIVLAFWLLGWFIKLEFFYPYLWQEILLNPVNHELFPPFFKNPNVVQFFYGLPVVGLFLIFWPRPKLFFPLSLILWLSSMILACHIDTYNDATFVASWWVAVWLVWFSFHLNKIDENFRRHACLCAKAIVGVIFFGGLVGKLTPEYWNGDIIYNIFFIQGTNNAFNRLTQFFPQETWRLLAQYISWFIILGEGFLSLAIFWPNRFIFIAGPILMLGITLFSTWRIVSVIGSLMGLMLGCLYLIRDNAKR